MTRDREYFLAGMAVSHCRAANAIPVGAHEHREAAIAIFLTPHTRCVDISVASYRIAFQFIQRPTNLMK